tara:strand:- start:127 stop:543 length:417 start_codon:yes stop_codon:yes gene_type:complete
MTKNIFNNKAWMKCPVKDFIKGINPAFFDTTDDPTTVYTQLYFKNVVEGKFGGYPKLGFEPEFVYILDYESTTSDEEIDAYNKIEKDFNPAHRRPEVEIIKHGGVVEHISVAKIQNKKVFRWYGGNELFYQPMFTYFE